MPRFPVIFWKKEVIFPGINYQIFLTDTLSQSTILVSSDSFSGKFVVFPSADYIDSKGFNVGTLCEVYDAAQTLDSGFILKIRGLSRVAIWSISKEEYEIPDFFSYRHRIYLAEVSNIPAIIHNISICKSRFIEYINNVLKLFYESSDRSKQSFFAKHLLVPNVSLIYAVDVCTALCFGYSELKFAILRSLNLYERIELLIKLSYRTGNWQNLISAMEQYIKQKVTNNVQKQQKEFYLREKLKVIKQELGDASLKDSELKRLMKKFKSKKFPAKVKQKIADEFRKLEICSAYSSEATVIRTYLEWLLDLPWLESSKDQDDLSEVKSNLDSKHFGLDKIKDRVLEHIAVTRKASSNKGTIICFVGPPGVGKTSLAISIASALNKQFVKISLGGVYDEADIRGHRRTYVGSMPGRIIKALKQSKSNNPVILLDEIDKMGGGYHGDPVNALLEVLDPKQNTNFEDHYIEEEFDLSKVMFIATANTLDTISEPLLDRMELIYLESYTEQEKLSIAKTHLLGEVFKETGLKDELKFTDEALLFIIQRYTKEAGVRNLKQQLLKIARKFVKKQLLENVEEQIVKEAQVKEYLEYEIYDHTERDEEGLPGVVNGMAFTSYGGDLLPIEVNHMPGKGNLSITGNLKDTMRESASVALAFVRANEEKFGLKDANCDWNNIDINLHVPAGGIPKDGPSAGVTIATAIISSFSGKVVSPKVAMTGEITLRGKVLAIGGIREKVISAVRGGVDTIFFPESNTRNLVDIPEEIRKTISLIPVKNYQDIFDRLFK